MTSCFSLTEHTRRWPDLTLAQRQRLGVESSGAPLNDDGVEGPRTRGGIYIAPGHPHSLIQQAVRASLNNAREEGGNNRGVWPALFYGALDELPELDAQRWRAVEQGPWCAAFVSWCIREAYGKGQPQAWGARRLVRRWAASPGQEVTLHTAQAGDLIAWRRDVAGEPAAGHVGIVFGRWDGLLLVMEGNGSRKGGAVGLYGYDVRSGARRGTSKPQEAILFARRPDLVLEG